MKKLSDISPEDRERLVSVKYRELLHKATDEDDEYVLKLMKRMRALSGSASQGSQSGQQTSGGQQVPERKRSAFEVAISNALGLG